MVRVKSVSADGIYYLVNGWRKYKSFWLHFYAIGNDDKRVLFKDTKSARASLTKLFKIMPEYRDDKITFEEVYTH